MSRTTQYFANLRSVTPMTVYAVTVIEGEGTAEKPVRPVVYYIDEDGETLFANDPRGVIREPGQRLADGP